MNRERRKSTQLIHKMKAATPTRAASEAPENAKTLLPLLASMIVGVADGACGANVGTISRVG